MLKENFNTILEKQRQEIQSNIVLTEKFMLDESLHENLKPSPLKSLDQIIKERQTETQSRLQHFLEEIRTSIKRLHQKSTEEERAQLRVWIAKLWIKRLKWDQTTSSTENSFSEEEVVAALEEGDGLLTIMEMLTLSKWQQPPLTEKETPSTGAQVTANIDADNQWAPMPDEEGFKIIYAIIQRCVNDCQVEMISGLYRLSLMLNPLQRDLWMEYAQHTWVFETADIAESIYRYALEIFPGDFYVRICIAEFYHATEKDLEAKAFVTSALDQLKAHHCEHTPTYLAFAELNEELKAEKVGAEKVGAEKFM